MNRDLLLQHFDRISEAPDAVARLRRFILDLAVRGKLVEQDPADEPAAELLKRIQAEKARLVKEGLTRKGKPVADFEEGPFILPNSWEWSQLAIVGIISPRNVAGDDVLASFVPMPMISAEYGVSNQHEIRPWREIKSGYTHFAEGDVGLAKITPCFENGKSTVFRGLTGGLGAGTTELHIVRPILLNADYILIFLKSPHFIGTGIPKMTGTAGQKRVPTEYFTASPLPLPPLAEQHRIVAKVDELMALCDQLDAARIEREAQRDRLTAASLHRIGTAAVTTLPAAARFHLDHLPRLTTRVEHIKQLRQTILNLAVRGRLVPQDPDDERLKEFDCARPHEGDIWFSIPKTWCWVPLRCLGRLKGGGTPSKSQNDFWVGDIPWVSPKDMKRDYIKKTQMAITPEAISASAVQLIESGSILFVVRGMILAHSFPVAIACVPLTINQDMKAITLHAPEMGEYVLRALKGVTPLILGKVQRSSHGTCRIEGADYSELLIPLPPLAEQHRIVAKVDELMALCDQLEAQITSTETDSRRLLEAVLRDALNPVA